jgi:NTE family protein
VPRRPGDRRKPRESNVSFDVLVLGVGGVLGEAWMTGVLAGLEEAGSDPRAARSFLGSSAGSIVAASLAGGVSPLTRFDELPEQPPVDEVPEAVAPGVVRKAVEAASAPLAALALNWATPGGALVRRLALGRVPEGTRSLGGVKRWLDGLDVQWDGRLRVTAVEVESGRRVVFGSGDAPSVPVSDAVVASCAIPGVFRPLRLDGRRYVDGGAWSPTNMDAADMRDGDRVLCLNPTAAAGALGPVSRSVAAAESLVLRRRGADVQVVNPDDAAAETMGPNLMRRSGREAVMAAGLAQGRRLAKG